MKKYSLILVSIAYFGLYSSSLKAQDVANDRKYWANLCYRISAPILSNMSKGELQKNMIVEVSPAWGDRNIKLTYMEAFGRLMAGVSPWLSLPDDNTAEGKQRKQLRAWALKSYAHAVDPNSPDYLLWHGDSQALVDAAFIAQSLLRAPETLWHPLDDVTKARYIKEFKSLRKIQPPYNNWILFRAMIEAFLASIDEEYDGFALRLAIHKMNEWYVGDGWYTDGPGFALDYYNAYVIQPMLVEVIETLQKKNIYSYISLDLALRRMQRYNQQLERLISPEGTFPAMGRSLTYRMAAFQPLALSAWKYGMPENTSYGQVRSALTTVMKNMFETEGNFGKNDFLQLGFVGHQPEIADYYTNNGSLYLTSLVFLPLALDPKHEFWIAEPEDWTSKKAWSGKSFPKDYVKSIKK